jgi:hypothetical protein
MTSLSIDAGTRHESPISANWIAIAALALSLLGGLVTALRSYGDDSQVVSSRVSVVETRQSEGDKRIEERLNRIDRAIDRFETKLDALRRERPGR